MNKPIIVSDFKCHGLWCVRVIGEGAITEAARSQSLLKPIRAMIKSRVSTIVNGVDQGIVSLKCYKILIPNYLAIIVPRVKHYSKAVPFVSVSKDRTGAPWLSCEPESQAVCSKGRLTRRFANYNPQKHLPVGLFVWLRG